ncbi:hypothetical protein DSM104440_00270 [Usitatibacter palustris]|uniref:Uncharacterized protein n=2 Tax=Usitatibacter palustris TaxID=2732487 RepID=A0A6M4H1V2_9PROT|nr:hypothetical protein DSM104440_00270 [Usitatibacter palustris]
MDRDSAKSVVEAIEAASAKVNESLHTVMCNESLGTAKVYGRLVGDFLGISYTNALARIWKAYPDLEPPEMKTPYVEAKPSLTAESRAAIQEGLTHALEAMDRVRATMIESDPSLSLRKGDIAELEATVDALAAFLERPRFREEPSTDV